MTGRPRLPFVNEQTERRRATWRAYRRRVAARKKLSPAASGPAIGGSFVRVAPTPARHHQQTPRPGVMTPAAALCRVSA